MEKNKEKIRTLFISDIHIGLFFSKVKKLYKVLEYYDVENIYFIGDTLNSIKLQKQKQKLLNRLIEEISSQTQLYFLQGNHDKEMHYNDAFLEEIVYTTLQNKKYLLIHGDIFDDIEEKRSIFIHILGESVYFIALHLNNIALFLFKLFGFSKPFLVTKFIKDYNSMIKNHIRKYKLFLSHYAKKRELDGVICGHIHYPENEIIENIHYLNCGDWIENCSFIVETLHGELKLLTYSDITKDY